MKGYVVEGYPERKLSQSAWTFWRRIDPEGAGEYLREFVKGHGIAEANFERITIDLTFGNAESLAILRQFAQANPHLQLCKTVTNALERSEPDWTREAVKLGRQWRKSRDYETLEYLTNQIIDRAAPGGLDASAIVELFGKPDSQVDRCYTFYSTDEKTKSRNGFLFVEVDEKGKIAGWKLDRSS